MMESVRYTDPAFKKPRYEDHPRAILDVLRAGHESGHFKQQRRDWNHPPLTLGVPTNTLSIRQCHDFCWKTCALYMTQNIGGGSDDLINYIWVKWFQGDATNIEYDNFIIKHVEAHTPKSPKSLPEMIEAHLAICLQVQRQLLDIQPFNPATSDYYLSHADLHLKYNARYKFLSSFRKVFIIVDFRMWYREGVLLVFSDKLSGLDIETETTDFDVPEFSTGDQGHVIRISLDKAIRFLGIMSNATTD